MNNNPDLNILYLQKGETITQLEILQERLNIVNKKIIDYHNSAAVAQNKEAQKNNKEEKADKDTMPKKEK